MNSRLFLALLLFLPASLRAADPAYLEELLQKATLLKLADQSYWRRLLHYRRNFFGVYGSEIDDPRYFLSPKGRRDPHSELEATLRAFSMAPSSVTSRMGEEENDLRVGETAAACRFPARYAWLKEQLAWDEEKMPKVSCLRFERWRTHMNAESVSLVFASYYMNNPASMYGHTFLRLNGKGRDPNQRLLDYTVNYAATVTTNNGILFAVYGLTGGYRGHFSTMPYYMKVQEYNNLESRDLWEYQLDLSPTAVERLVQHLWEVGQHSIAYYFLNKNCSYQILPLLEVADEKLNLSHPFLFKAIPVDTLRKILDQPGLVSGSQLRPSHVTRLLAERAQLSPPEINATEALVWASETSMDQRLAPFPKERQALMLDTAYSFFRYKVGFSRNPKPKVSQQDNLLLRKRNALGPQSTSPPVIPQTLAPENAHKTGRVGVSFGFSNRSQFEELSLRAAVHDQADPPEGFLPGSQLQMFLLRLRFDNNRKALYPQQFTLVDLMSFSPWDRWIRKPSWKIQTGLQVANDLPKDPEHALYYGLGGGSGLSFSLPWTKRTMVYALAEADSGIGRTFRDRYRLGGGGSTGFFLDLGNYYRLRAQARFIDYVGHPGSATQVRLTQSVSLMKDFEVRIQLDRQNHYKEVLTSLLWFL